jgi:hypothetical protein
MSPYVRQQISEEFIMRCGTCMEKPAPMHPKPYERVKAWKKSENPGVGNAVSKKG